MALYGSSDKYKSTYQYSSIAIDDPDRAFSYESAFVYADPNTNSVANTKKYASIFTYSKPTSGIRQSSGERVGDASDSWTYVIVSGAVLLFSWCLLVVTFPVTLWYYLKVLPQHERLLIFRLGRLQSLKGPGKVLTLPFVDNWQRVDTRERAFSIPPQQFITADNGVVELGADVHLQVVDVVRSAMHVRDLDRATRTLGQSTLVNSLCKKTCSQLEKEKHFLSIELQESLNQTTLDWGVEIVRVELSFTKVLKPPNQSSAVGPVLSALRSMFTPSSTPLPASPSELPTPADPPFGLYEQLKQNLHDLSTSNSLSGLDFLLRVQIVGSKESVFGLEVKAGTGRVLQEDEITRVPDAALSLSEEDLHAIFNHTLTPLQAYISGKLQVQGDVQLLMRLEGLLKASKDHSSKRSVMTV